MQRFAIVLILPIMGSIPTNLLAGTIPYKNVGTVAPQNVLYATVSGNVTGYFIKGGNASGGGARDVDHVELYDVTAGTYSGFLFDNQTTATGQTADFGVVTKGDVLEFILENGNFPGETFSSASQYSTDGVNHAYTTAFAGGTLAGVTIPSGTYVGMEDLPLSVSDLNYNDDTFVFTDVTAVSATPEPDGLLLVGTGALAVAAGVRRRLRQEKQVAQCGSVLAPSRYFKGTAEADAQRTNRSMY